MTLRRVKAWEALGGKIPTHTYPVWQADTEYAAELAALPTFRVPATLTDFFDRPGRFAPPAQVRSTLQ